MCLVKVLMLRVSLYVCRFVTLVASPLQRETLKINEWQRFLRGRDARLSDRNRAVMEGLKQRVCGLFLEAPTHFPSLCVRVKKAWMAYSEPGLYLSRCAYSGMCNLRAQPSTQEQWQPMAHKLKKK